MSKVRSFDKLDHSVQDLKMRKKSCILVSDYYIYIIWLLYILLKFIRGGGGVDFQVFEACLVQWQLSSPQSFHRDTNAHTQLWPFLFSSINIVIYSSKKYIPKTAFLHKLESHWGLKDCNYMYNDFTFQLCFRGTRSHSCLVIMSITLIRCKTDLVENNSHTCCWTRAAYRPLASSSSSWVPFSTTQPSRIPRMMSAFCIVDSRCAITMVVRPLDACNHKYISLASLLSFVWNETTPTSYPTSNFFPG